MNTNTNTKTTRRTSTTFRKHLTKAVAGLAIFVTAIIGSTMPAAAEVDTLGSQCITVNGATRGCGTNFQIVWGSGWSWTVGASTNDVMVENGSVTVEVKLNRKGMSNTPWMTVSRAIDTTKGYTYQSMRGTDPTYGAWVRLCTNLNTGKYCNGERYVTDNS